MRGPELIGDGGVKDENFMGVVQLLYEYVTNGGNTPCIARFYSKL